MLVAPVIDQETNLHVLLLLQRIDLAHAPLGSLLPKCVLSFVIKSKEKFVLRTARPIHGLYVPCLNSRLNVTSSRTEDSNTV